MSMRDEICIPRKTVCVVLGAAAAAVVAVLVLQLPAIARYVKAARM
jgi:hypothetical protein